MAETVYKRRLEAEENAVLDIQFLIIDILRKDKISKTELAKRLALPYLITSIFENGYDPTVKEIVQIFDALNYKVCFSYEKIQDDSAKAKPSKRKS